MEQIKPKTGAVQFKSRVELMYNSSNDNRLQRQQDAVAEQRIIHLADKNQVLGKEFLRLSLNHKVASL